MKHQVFLQGFNNESGYNESESIKVCECDNIEYAEKIKCLFEMDNSELGDPTTSVWIKSIVSDIKTEGLILCADTSQITMALECNGWMKKNGVNSVVCFSQEETETIKSTYQEYGIPYMIAQVSESDLWTGLEYDLKMSSFEKDDFEVILSVME